jgi:ArsR family transcriptional regulator, arsenate/arsenite/antimonite-responsive transcriptional repressor
MKILMRVLKALADPNRMRIMKMLQHKEMCVCELTEALRIAQPSVSRHLKILEQADLLEQRREGLWINYRWNSSPDDIHASDLLAQIEEWLEEDPQIKELVQKSSGLDRNVICGRNQPRREITAFKDATK